MTNFMLGLVQMNAGISNKGNEEFVADCIRTASRQGADLICTPENSSFLVNTPAETKERSYVENEDPFLRKMRETARETERWLIIGSLPVLVERGKVANRQFVIDPGGDIIARYDKIHLFDVDLLNGESYRESDHYIGGSGPVIAVTPFGKIGLSICYDVRFPHLYREYALRGAEILNIPAAFTQTTGQAHWHSLMRARAIENGCFVVAAAQSGHHDCGKETYGHSLVVSPWGELIHDSDRSLGVSVVDVNLESVARTRMQIPSLANSKTLAPAIVEG